MRAILIDPKLQRIVDIELVGDGEAAQLVDMRRLIGTAMLGHARLSDEGDTIWCDDTILARGDPCWAFRLGRKNNGVIFGGVCIVVGADRHGNGRPPQIPIAMIENYIDWLGEIIPQVDWVEHKLTVQGQPVVGFAAVTTYSRPRK